MPIETIRIRITPRDPYRSTLEPREAFWAKVRANEYSTESIASYEGKLTRGFGPALQMALITQLSRSLTAFDQELIPRSLLEFDSRALRTENRPLFADRHARQINKLFAQLLEQRQQASRAVIERLIAARGLFFATRIAGYSSLNLDLSTGSLKRLAKAFDDDFESFRVFLDAFVPVAFAGVFTEAQADRLDFEVKVPASLEQVFRAVARESEESPSLVAGAAKVSATSSRERAEWLWRLANGSLLIPVLLALLVMYQGMKMLSEIRRAQYEALQPVMEHQLKLLEQDRLRFAREATSAQQQVLPQPATPPMK